MLGRGMFGVCLYSIVVNGEWWLSPGVYNQKLGDSEYMWSLKQPCLTCDVCWEMEFGAAVFVGNAAIWVLESMIDSVIYMTEPLPEELGLG